MAGFNFKVEFAVQMKCNDCKEKIKKELEIFGDSIKIEHINVDEQRLVLLLNETSPSSFRIQELIENKLKLNTIIRGTGDFFTTVCELRGSKSYPNVFGVARFIQNENRQCLIEAVIDGLKPLQTYRLGIHQYGDLSDEHHKSIGHETFNIGNNIPVETGKLTLKRKLNDLDLVSKIGQSLAISLNNEIIAAGVIARASKILNNTKKICDCSGKTLWQERETNQTY